MILSIFITILGLAVLGIFLGQFVSAPPVQLGSYTLLFLLGLSLLTGGVFYKSGEVMTTVPVYASACVTAFPTCGFSCDQTCNETEVYVVNNTITTTDQYSNFDNEIYLGITYNHIFGFILCIISAFGFIVVLMNLDRFSLKSRG